MILALSIIGGLVLLVVGADILIRGASHLAFALGIPPLIVGLTVVAFGTSAPELAVSVQAALADEAGVGLGNVFGSNIVNTLFILGASALITPLVVSRQLVRIDVPLMVLVSIVTLGMAWDGEYTKLDGGILFGGLFAYMLLQFNLGRTGGDVLEDLLDPDELEASEAGEPVAKKTKSAIPKALLQCLFGLIGLVVGSYFLVEGAVELAGRVDVSDEIIGLTIVAIGTSLPEIVTSIMAAVRGQRDLAVGNVVGSNMFNLLVVLGIASLVAPTPIQVDPSLIRFDLPVMLLSAIICLPIFFTGARISRLEGGLMLLGYFIYSGLQVYWALPGA